MLLTLLVTPVFATSLSDHLRNDEVGAGADFVMWVNEKENATLEKITTQYKYDWNNQNHQLYVVAQVNIWKYIKGLTGGK